MADLTDLQSADAVKIVGADASGVESNPAQVTANGGVHANLRNASGTEVGTAGSPLRTDPTGSTTQPVSGTVTANVGTTGGLALDATLTGGTQKAIARGAAKGATTAGDVTTTNQSADRQAIDVQIRTSAGVAVDTFGGGTQYADGTARGTATGTLAMVDDGVNIQSAAGDTSGRQIIVGAAASGAAKAGNPVQIGGVYNSTPPTVTTGQAVELQATSSGDLITQPNYRVVSGSFTANSQTSANQLEPAQSHYINLSGTWVGTITPQVSYDGVNWQNWFVYNYLLTGNFSGLTTNNIYVAINPAPFFRLTTTAWTSGTANYSITSSQVVDTVYIRQQTPYALTTTTRPGVPLTNSTYSAASTFAAANLATDIFTITGSATKTVYVRRIRVQATQTTGAVRDIILLRRSTANTAGTSSTLTNVTHDTFNAAATAVVRSYTANPTLGTLVGNIRRDKIWIPATTAAPEENVWEFGSTFGQPVTLRGTSEVLAVNLNGVTSGGNSFAISVEWVEA